MQAAVRGAVQVSENGRVAIWDASARLVGEIMKINSIREEDIVSIVFSLTEDLTKGNPAAGLRRMGFADVPLFCLQEARMVGGMPRVIRVLLSFEAPHRGWWKRLARRRPVPVYLDGAVKLRPDLDQGGAPSGY